MSIAQPDTVAAFHKRIDGHNLTALWSVLGSVITPEPTSGCEPYLWRYSDVRAAMIEASGLITTEEAERRVLVLENPGLRGKSKITTSLYAGIQIVMSGEVAPTHRHSQSAMRFVLEGSGAHTTVDGERIRMEPGDLVLTPAMTWHDHGNESDQPTLWLDALDIPVVQFLDASFLEHGAIEQQPVVRPTGDSYARYGHNLLPVDLERRSQTSPVVNYPYRVTRDALDRMKHSGAVAACHGVKLRYTNPVTGDWAMPTIGACCQLLPQGFSTTPYRSTDATVFAPIEGHGRSRIGDRFFEWKPRDVFVVPSWKWVTHYAEDESVLFSYSDRPIQEKLDLFREDRSHTSSVLSSHD